MLVTTHYMDEAEYCDRISIMVAGRIGALGTPAELKQQFGVDVDRRAVRAAGAPQGGMDRKADAGASERSLVSALGLLRKEVYHILPRPPDAARCSSRCRSCRCVLFGFAIRTDVDDVRLAIVDPAPDNARSRCAVASPPPVCSYVAVVPRTDDLDPLFQTGAAQQAVVFEPGFRADLGSGDRAVAGRSPMPPSRIPAACCRRTPRPWSSISRAAVETRLGRLQRGVRPTHRPAGPDALQPDARELQPVRARVDGVRADDHLVADDRHLADPREGDGDDGGAAGVAAAPVGDHRRQGVPYLVIGFISVIARARRGAADVSRPVRGSVLLLLVEGAALHPRVARRSASSMSARTSSQRVAMMGALLGTMLPNVLLSGFIFPVESMPAPLRLAVVCGARALVREIARGHHAERRSASNTSGARR